jgi:hypothetical protein
MQRHRHQEFVRFLNVIEKPGPAGKTIHAISRQLRRPQAPKHSPMARTPFAIDIPLHADIGFLAQRARGLLRHPDPTLRPRRLSLRR